MCRKTARNGEVAIRHSGGSHVWIHAWLVAKLKCPRLPGRRMPEAGPRHATLSRYLAWDATRRRAPGGAHDDAGIRIALGAGKPPGFPKSLPAAPLPAARPNQSRRLTASRPLRGGGGQATAGRECPRGDGRYVANEPLVVKRLYNAPGRIHHGSPPRLS